MVRPKEETANRATLEPDESGTARANGASQAKRVNARQLTSAATAKTALLASSLCLACGLCCDGTLFKDVELQEGDKLDRVNALGILPRADRGRGGRTAGLEAKTLKRLKPQPAGPTVLLPFQRSNASTPQRLRFPQPCAALCSDLRCRIYANRPSRCRQFECALFQAVDSGATTTEAALRIIRKTRQRAERIRSQLRALGNEDEHTTLSLRFRKLRKRMESVPLDKAAAAAFGELSLAVHELNLILRREFLPDPAD